MSVVLPTPCLAYTSMFNQRLLFTAEEIVNGGGLICVAVGALVGLIPDATAASGLPAIAVGLAAPAFGFVGIAPGAVPDTSAMNRTPFLG